MKTLKLWGILCVLASGVVYAKSISETQPNSDIAEKSSVVDQYKVDEDPFAYRKIQKDPKKTYQNNIAGLIVKEFPGLNGYWVSGSTSVYTLKVFNKLNFIATFILLSGNSRNKTVCKEGAMTANTEMWNSFDENEQKFAFDILGLTTIRCCAPKPIPVLPPVYLSTLKKVERLYATKDDKRDMYFIYPLLAMAHIIEGEENVARETLKKMKTSCDSEGALFVARAGDCWKAFDESYIVQDPPKIYHMLDDINEIIENHGVSYETGLYDTIKLQSKKYKGTGVEFVITIFDIKPGENNNYIRGFLGSFSGKSEFDKESSNRDASHILIDVPEKLSDKLISLRPGDIVTIKGKASGLMVTFPPKTGPVESC